MEKLGEHTFPTLTTFKQAMDVASAARDYGGIITNNQAARVLGYNVTEETHLSGPIYIRIRDMCMFGLLTKDKSALRLTPLGEEVLNPDFQKADAGKAKAVRSIGIISKAFETWNGILPEPTAFHGKLVLLTEESHQECKDHAPALYKLFQEAFPILRVAANIGTVRAIADDDRSDYGDRTTIPEPMLEKREIGRAGRSQLGELRTRIGTLIITDESTIDLAIEYLEVLRKQVKAEDVAKTRTEGNNDTK